MIGAVVSAELLIEQAQADLDDLYGAIAPYAGDPKIDNLLTILRKADDTLAHLREVALAIDADVDKHPRR